MSRPPASPPIGLRVAQTARIVSQAFDSAMAEAGGSASAWQVLLLVRSKEWGTQSLMAEAMGVSSATLTHHLNKFEEQGLVRRWRDAANRRVQHVELTDEGRALFDRLRHVAVRHDKRLRAHLSDEEIARLGDLLDKLRAAVEPEAAAAAEGVAPAAGGAVP